MTLQDNRKDGAEYAKRFFLNYDIKGTAIIAYRDIPILMEKHVSGTTTLDYGCGVGLSSRYFKSLGLDVDGVDINPAMIKYAKEKDPTGNYKLIESGKIPADDNHYDLAYSVFVMNEISSKQDLVKIMQEITRVLKPGGTFMMIAPHEEAVGTNWLTVNSDFEENKNIKSGGVIKTHLKEPDIMKYDYYWREEDYRGVMSEAGLSVVQMHHPLGKDEDGYDWVHEKLKPAVTLYVARKPAES